MKKRKAQTISLDERVFILSKTYASIPLYFAHWEDAKIKPEQLDSVYHTFLNRAIKTEDRKDFFLLMWEFFGLLNNGHSWYRDDELNGNPLPLGFSCLEMAGQRVVTWSSIQTLKKGDVVVSINDKSIDDYYTDFSKYISA
ncbi:MAG: hypothetical protein NTV06_00655, partial [candidate division Zixibacteria bacterium]|nr:hypothetical protein [candidate division Zixibacteria bacterium]